MGVCVGGDGGVLKYIGVHEIGSEILGGTLEDSKDE